MFGASENELNMANDSACVADFLPNTAYLLCQNSLSLLEICIWQFTVQTPDQGLLVVADVDFFALLARFSLDQTTLFTSLKLYKFPFFSSNEDLLSSLTPHLG